MNRAELDRCLHLIGYWSNEDEAVIKKLLSKETDVIKEYLNPFSRELDANLIAIVSTEGKRDLIQFYIWQFWDLQGFYKHYNEILFTGSIGNYTPVRYEHTNEAGAKRKLNDFENYVVNSHQLFDMMFEYIQISCVTFQIDFYEVCRKLKFDLRLFDSGGTLFFMGETDGKSNKTNGISEDGTGAKNGLPPKEIIFTDTNTLKAIHEGLKGFFQGKETELLTLLEGGTVEKPLHFPDQQNRFAEVFSRAHHCQKIAGTKTDLQNWIARNFTYLNQRTKKPTPCNTDTLRGIFSPKPESPEVPKNKRIEIEGLPYITLSDRVDRG